MARFGNRFSQLLLFYPKIAPETIRRSEIPNSPGGMPTDPHSGLARATLSVKFDYSEAAEAVKDRGGKVRALHAPRNH